jgi:hypothetical protein
VSELEENGNSRRMDELEVCWFKAGEMTLGGGG